MTRLLLGLLIAVFYLAAATAKTPPEVLKPYKEYRAALEAGDDEKAYKKAKEAWETAEDMLGDHKTTGDLAANFGNLEPDYKIGIYKGYEMRMKAHKRAIELAKYHEERAVDTELDRHLKRIDASMSLTRTRNGRMKDDGKSSHFKKMEKALDRFGRRGSTFEADMEVLRTRYHELSYEPEKGIEAAQRAEIIYENSQDGLSTHYPIMLKLFKGNVLNDTGDQINAVLEYQNVMQNLEGELPADHSFLKLAFKEWVKTRTEIVDAGRFKEAEAAGLCKCWPFEEYSEDVLPIERVPPVMPRMAERSGHVNLMFDVDTNGTPINIKVTSSTEKIFESAAIKAVSKWTYSPIGHGEEEAKIRKGIASKITFRLADRKGNIIPEREN